MKNNFAIKIFSLLQIFCMTFTEDQMTAFEKRQYIRQNDVFSIDLTKIVNFRRNSFDFSCSNDKVQLPGMPSPDMTVHLPDTKIEFLENKYSNSYILGISKTGTEFSRIRLDPSELLSNQIQNYIDKNSLICNDLEVRNSMAFILCMKNDDKKSFVFFTYQIMEDFIFHIHSFTLDQELQNPKIKIDYNLDIDYDSENKNTLEVYVFNKQIKKEENYEKEHSIYRLSLEIQKHKINEENNEIKQIETNASKINVVYQQQKVKIHNIIIDKQLKFFLFVIGVENENSKIVKQCSKIKNNEILQLEECKNFTTEQIAHFFYKEGNYVLVTPEQKIIMCDMKKDSCDDGQMKSNWKTDLILLEGNILLLAINDQSNDQNKDIFFLYNFKKSWFNWFTPQFEEHKNLQLFQKDNLTDTDKYFLFNYQKKGFSIFDLTFNPDLIIKSEDIQKSEPIKLFLGKELVLSLDLIPWDGKTIVNESKSYPEYIQSTNSDIYQIKLPWRSGNEFIQIQNQQIGDYFQLSNMTIESKNIFESPSLIYSTGKYVYVFNDQQIKKTQCFTNIQTQKIECDIIDWAELKLDMNQLQNIQHYSNLLYFEDTMDESGAFFMNLETLEFKKLLFQKNQPHLKNCKFSSFLICISDQENNSDKLKFFEINSDYIKEIPTIHECQRLIDNIEKKLGSQNKVDKISINDFDIDSGDENHLVIHFILTQKDFDSHYIVEIEIIENKFTNKIDFVILKIDSEIDFKDQITKNTQLFLSDSQKIFLNHDPVYKMSIVQNSSFIQMPYIDASIIKDTYLFKERNLFGMVYFNRSLNQFSFAVQRLTGNSINQLIADYPIPIEENEGNFKIRIQQLNDRRIIVFLNDDKTGEIKSFFTFNEKGPLVYVKSLYDQIYINEEIFDLDIKEQDQTKADILFKNDKKFLNFKYNENNDIDSQVGTLGHLEKISVRSYIEELQVNEEDIIIKNPVQNETEREINLHKSTLKKIKISQDNEIMMAIQSDGEQISEIIGKQSVQNPLQSDKNIIYKLLDKQTFDMKSILVDQPCLDFHIHEDYFYCLKIANNQTTLIIKLLSDQSILMQKVLSFNVNTLDFVLKNHTENIFILRDIEQNKIFIIKADTANGKIKKLILNEQQLLVDSLYISDYSYFIENEDQNNVLILFLFDEFKNLWFNTKIDLVNMRTSILQNVQISLDQTDFIHYKMSCSKINDYQCIFIGTNKMTIYNIENSKNQNYFKITESSQKYNVMYTETFDDSFNPLILQNKEYIITMDLNRQDIVHVYKNNERKYQYHSFSLGQNKQVLNAFLIENKLHVILKDENQTLKINSFTLHNNYSVEIKSYIDSQQFAIQFDFIEKSKISLEFEVERQNQEQQRSLKGKIMTILNIILACLLAFLLIYLVVILRERNNLKNRILIINEQNPSNIPLNE